MLRASSLFCSLVSITYLSLGLSLHAKETKLYVGKNSTETDFTFNGYLLTESATEPSKDQANQLMELQVAYLFSAMSNHELQNAVPKRNHTFLNPNVTKVGPSSWKVSYTYKGTAVIENTSVTNGTDTYDYVVNLPINPETVFESTQASSGHYCGDEEHNVEKYYWYFFNPKAYGCKAKKGTDYDTYTAKYKRIANTKVSYPEYNRLVDSNGDITISLVMGLNDESMTASAYTSKDINADNYRTISKSLKSMGFKSTLYSETEVQEFFGNLSNNIQMYSIPTIEDFKLKTTKANIRVRMLLMPASDSWASSPFQNYLKYAFEKESVVMSAGHSGLGAYLNVNSIEASQGFKIEFPQDKYQIFFFNGCSSYPYYNDMFMARKGGTKNLDILTNGLATLFSAMPNSNTVFIKAIALWGQGKTISFQQLANNIDSYNLFGVNGDEDNPTDPKAVE